MSVSPDSRLQRGSAPNGNPDNGFGVRVQVQGIRGHSFVVMNNGGQQDHRDWPVGRSADGEEEEEYPCEFHFQRHPEIRPYDPQNNDLKVLVSDPKPDPPPSDTEQPGRETRTRTRTCLSAPGRGAGSESQNEPVSGGSTPASDAATPPARSPNSVDTDSIPSVGRLIDRFSCRQQNGRRGGPRSSMDQEERRRRSRSVEVEGQQAPYRDSPGGVCAPGPARTPRLTRVRFANGDSSSEGNGREEKKLVNGLSRSTSTIHTQDADERDTQVTPDLLKGQKEISVDLSGSQISVEPEGDAVKQNHFPLPQEGKVDNGGTTHMTDHTISKDHSAVVKALQNKAAALEKQVSVLKNKLDTETKNEKMLAKACEKARTQKNILQEQLAKHQEEICKLRTRLSGMEAELQSTKDKLVQVTAERDRSRLEMKDLQQQLSDMHDELDQAKEMQLINTEKETLLKDMTQLRSEWEELLQVQEEQEEVLRWRERELNALKGALQDEVDSHHKDMDLLREDFLQKIQVLQRDAQQAQESVAALGQQKAQMEEQKAAADTQLEVLNQERETLRRQASHLEERVEELNHCIHKSKALEKHLEQRANQLEVEKQQVEETLVEVRRKEDEVCLSNQTLAVHLENVQGQLTKLKHEHGDLKVKLKEQKSQSEDLWKTKSDLDEEKKRLDRTVDLLQRKMTSMMQECEVSTDRLQRQIEESRDVHQRALAELTAQLQEKGVELERARQTVKTLHEELFPVEADLQRCRRESQEARLRSRQLEERLQELEDKSSSQLDERDRKVKLLEGRISQLEEDLKEERSSADHLMERVDKTKEQMDQTRIELLQEKTVRQDLECDKTTLDRQNKDLKSRLGHLEGSQKTNQDSLLSKLNGRIQELEERLQGEERDNTNLLQTNRKLERKVKEMKMQVDEEHISLQTQRDQLTQRLKTAKRQIDEVEAEMERLEHDKKRLQREMDEQLENNQHLQDQLNALRSHMRSQKKSRSLMRDDDNDEDDLGSD